MWAIFLFVFLSCAKDIHLPYSHTEKTIVLYEGNNPLYIELTFTHKEFRLDDSLQGKELSLFKAGKNKIHNITKFASFDYRPKSTIKDSKHI